MRVLRFSGPLLVFLAACGSPAEPSVADPFEGSYTIYQVDSSSTPFAVSQDSTCSEINLGGSATLNGRGGFVLVLDQRVTICSGIPQGGYSEGLMTGHYSGADSSLTFVISDGTYSFPAHFDAGNFTPAAGGRAPNLTFQVGTHTYYAANYTAGAYSRARVR